MGKKQHSKDQLYITQTEWADEWGGAKTNRHVAHKVGGSYYSSSGELRCPSYFHSFMAVAAANSAV